MAKLLALLNTQYIRKKEYLFMIPNSSDWGFTLSKILQLFNDQEKANRKIVLYTMTIKWNYNLCSHIYSVLNKCTLLTMISVLFVLCIIVCLSILGINLNFLIPISNLKLIIQNMHFEIMFEFNEYLPNSLESHFN